MLVESHKRKESDLKNLSKKIQKDREACQKKLRELSSVEFACTTDAKKATSRLLKRSKYHELTDLKITKVNNSKTANSQNYKLEAKVVICQEKIALEKRSTGRFILATNVLNKEELTTE